jgi:hypothetical protein
MLVQADVSVQPLAKTCSDCRETKPVGDFYLRSDRKTPRSRCKACHRAKCNQRWHSDEALRDRNYDGWLRLTYSISLSDYNALAGNQGWACAICGLDPQIIGADQSRHARRLNVDHCHATGRVRGLLCGSCNRSLAVLERNASWTTRATAYLEAPPAGWSRTLASSLEEHRDPPSEG